MRAEGILIAVIGLALVRLVPKLLGLLPRVRRDHPILRGLQALGLLALLIGVGMTTWVDPWWGLALGLACGFVLVVGAVSDKVDELEQPELRGEDRRTEDRAVTEYEAGFRRDLRERL